MKLSKIIHQLVTFPGKRKKAKRVYNIFHEQWKKKGGGEIGTH